MRRTRITIRLDEIAGQLVSEYPDYEKGQKEYTFLSTRVSQ